MLFKFSSRPRRHLGFVAAILCLLVGCSGPPAEPRGKVSGKVTFDQKPVTEGQVVFSNSDMGIFLTAALKADGSFELLTPQGPGLSLGKYRVSITPPVIEYPPGPPPPGYQLKTFPNIPSQYRDPATSSFVAEVKLGENSFTFEMQR